MHHWFRLGERHAPRSPSGRGRLALFPLLLLLALPALVSVSAETSTSIVPAWSRIAEPEARLELARLLSLREGRLTEAREQYSQLLAQDPENPSALLGLARVLTRLDSGAAPGTGRAAGRPGPGRACPGNASDPAHDIS